jgi:hypothetical protein
VKKKRFYTKITKEEMIRAKTDKEFAGEILDRVDKFLRHIANIMYDFYGAKYDNALEREDILSFLKMSVLQAIQAYSPEKYDASKDETGNKVYLDGFRYISQMAKRFIKYFFNYHHRQKRIPPENMMPLEPNFLMVDEEKHDDFNFLENIVEEMLSRFEGCYYKDIHVYDIMKLLVEGYSHDEIAAELGIARRLVEKIISDNIEPGLGAYQLIFPFF